MPIALALEQIGITRYGRTDNLFETEPVKKRNYTMKSKKVGEKFYPAHYVMITGDIKLSPNDVEELKAAILKRIKNKVPNNTPNGIFAKAIGSVTKTSPGPSVGANPFAKTIGKIAIPAKRATPVSNAATVIAVLPMFWSAGI